ncbi:MAG: hypothetical protein MJ213_01245 [Bacilli bacterium]|nr:hypothetical protein [Bacilli bacterium]
MNMKKFALLGMMLPVFTMTVGCSYYNVRELTVDEAIEFSREHYDPHYYDGFIPSYSASIDTLAARNVKLFGKTTTYHGPVYDLIDSADIDMHDVSAVIDTDEIPLLHFVSGYIGYIVDYGSIVKALLGHFDTNFILVGEDLIYTINSDNLAPILNMVFPILRIIELVQPSEKTDQVLLKEVNMPDLTIVTGSKSVIAPTFYTSYANPYGAEVPEESSSPLDYLKAISMVQVSEAYLHLEAGVNRVGLLDHVNLSLKIKDLMIHMKEDEDVTVPNFPYFITSSNVEFGLSFAASYK